MKKGAQAPFDAAVAIQAKSFEALMKRPRKGNAI